MFKKPRIISKIVVLPWPWFCPGKAMFFTKSLRAFLAVFFRQSAQASAIQGGEKDARKDTRNIQNHGFT